MLDSIHKKLSSRLLRMKELAKGANANSSVTDNRIHIMDWEPILSRESEQWQKALAASQDGPRVLIGTTLGKARDWSNVEILLAVALTLRGARVHALLCDRHLPACMNQVFGKLPDQPSFNQSGAINQICDKCYPPVKERYAALGLPVHRYSELTTAEELTEASRIAASVSLSEMSDFKWQGVAVGEHALAGAVRFFGRSDLEEEPTAEAASRRYLQSALITTMAVQRLCDTYDFTVSCGSHGIYVPQGLVSEVARSRGVRVVNWHPAYRNRCLIFSEGDTYHKTLLNEPVDAWEHMRWDDELEAEIMEYLESRINGGKGDWISFNRDPEKDSVKLVKKMGVDFSRPCIGLLTNVAWDAQLHYGRSAFKNMNDWLIQTIAYFAKRPDLQLIVRVHPAEIQGLVKSRQPATEDIKKAFPQLPPNIFVIPPESTISTYDTMAQCNSVIIYATKTGIELAAQGTPVIVAGEAWIKNKGFALDASSPEEYFALLDRLPVAERLSPQAIQRARMYAYHFFLRRMIPISLFNESSQRKIGELAVEQLDDILPGRCPGLDVICNGILYGTEFISRAEEAEKVFA